MCDRRPTEYEEPAVHQDAIQRAEAEARNGLLQYDLGVQIVMEAIERRHFRLRSSTITRLHREALQDLTALAGSFRPGPVNIGKSQHVPPDAYLVHGLVEDMCDYVHDNWNCKTALHLAAYVMWRLNWIHPFTDGNGRTSRIVSYVVLSIKVNGILPGTPQIPDQIVNNRTPYFTALEAADAAWKNVEVVDVSELEALLGRLLVNQLRRAQKAAGLPCT